MRHPLSSLIATAALMLMPACIVEPKPCPLPPDTSAASYDAETQKRLVHRVWISSGQLNILDLRDESVYYEYVLSYAGSGYSTRCITGLLHLDTGLGYIHFGKNEAEISHLSDNELYIRGVGHFTLGHESDIPTEGDLPDTNLSIQ